MPLRRTGEDLIRSVGLRESRDTALRGDRKVRLRGNSAIVPALVLSFCFASSGFADTIMLSPAGVAAIRGKSRASPVRSADGKHELAHGRVVVFRDAQDLPTLPNPSRFFAFQPRNKRADGRQTWSFTAAEKWEWSWVLATHHTIDSLEDLRDMISNRDKRYGSVKDALVALRADIDPTGSLGLRDGSGAPVVTNPRIKPREGTVSRDLISPETHEERRALIKEARSQPADPLGYSPIDPLFGGGETPEFAIEKLVDAIARARKYGQPENGLLASCLAVARFFTEDLFVSEEKENGPDGETASRIRGFVFRARAAVLSYIEDVSPQGVAIRLERQAAQAGSLADALRHTQPDDDLPLDVFELARTALEVVGGMINPRNEDRVRVVEALLSLASGRADFRGRDAVALPPEIQSRQEVVAQQAFETLIKLSAAPTPGKEDTGAYFRPEILRFFGSSYAKDSYAKTAREVLVRSGVGGEREIGPLVNDLINLGLTAAQEPSDPRLAAIYVLKQLPANIRDERLRQRFQARINEQLDQLEERRRAGTGGPAESRFLELYRRTR